MARPAESTERTALVALGSELARSHAWDVLIHALQVRLSLDKREGLPELLRHSERQEATGPICDAGRLAAAFVGKLRVDGRGALADAMLSLLGGGPIDADPVLWLDEVRGKIATRSEEAATLRAHGRHEIARMVEDTLSLDLRVALRERLCADGRHDLADAVSRAIFAHEARERLGAGTPAPAQPPVPATHDEPAPDVAARWALADTLGRTHPADVLACALVTRLRAEGRDVLAGSIMMIWARGVAGPIVDPARLAADLVAQLRAEGRGELADAIASLVRGAAIDRDPCEIMAVWLNELAGPIVAPGPLAAALVSVLRRQRRDRLAEGVDGLMSADRWTDVPPPGT
ncbi:hypothetical protein [Sorangium cellulosum]|uniref:Uncharacterized protein n=1 Tax=Sorangium cellulosum TaxID=56 RepID=A0A150QNH4_SORCE|nr:hypothetical protein [Sorangium cellulosum]KYF69531.1 hypothetical protein BE15_06885 [Sorangium cellulosum]